MPTEILPALYSYGIVFLTDFSWLTWEITVSTIIMRYDSTPGEYE